MRTAFAIVLVILSFLLCLSNFYSVGYIILITVLSIYAADLFVFKTYFQKFVLLLFGMLAIIPIIGLVCWGLKVEVLPIYNVLGTLLFFMAINKISSKPPQRQSSRIFDRVDLVAISVALIPIIVIFLSYASSPNLPAALFQLTSEGWDNGSHILMMEDVSHAHGYVYGEKTPTSGLNPYPMAWHLATTDAVNGFGGNRFVSEQPIQTMLAYMTASIGWMVLTAYLFVLCTWRLYEHMKKKSLVKITEAFPIISVALLVGLIVFVASLMHGFTNYLGSIAYIILFVTMIIEVRQTNGNRPYVLAVLFGTMSVLTWFLTIPAVGIALLMMFLNKGKDWKSSTLQFLRDKKFIIFALLGVIAMVMQLYIFQKYSAVGGEDQLNVGAKADPFYATRGPLPLNQIFFAVISVAALVYAYSLRKATAFRHTLLTIIMPWLFLGILVFLYQNMQTGYNSYYLPKVLAISVVVAAIIAAIPFTDWVNKFASTSRYKALLVPTVSLSIVALLVIGTGQSAFGFSKLFQRNARTPYPVAEKVVSLLPQTTTGKKFIVILSNSKNYEDAYVDDHGKLELRLVNVPRNCSYGITKYPSMEKKIMRLEKCSDDLAKTNKSILLVTTSKDTAKQIDELHKENVKVYVTE